MKKKAVKRILGIVCCMTLSMSMLAGCGSADQTAATEATQETTATDETKTEAEAQEPVEAQPVEVTLGIWPEDTLADDIAMHEGFVETMKTKDPNVTYTPAYYKYATDTFMPMVESGNCPTVFESWFTEPQKLIASKAVADITSELDEKGWLNSMNPSIKELLSDKDGNIYGIPRDGYALGLMLNVELFEEAGLVDADGYPLYPKTMDELAQAAKTIKDKTGAAGFVLLAKDNAGGWHFSNIAWNFGATLCIDNGDGTFTSNLNSPEAIEAMEFVKSLKWDYDVLTADPTNEDWGTGFTQLGTGNAAMYIAANDAVNQPTQVNGLPVDKLAMCAIPEGPGGQYSLFGGTPYMFSKDAAPEQIGAALDYIEVMGKGPSVSEDAIAGMQADAENKSAAGVPVIPRFPCWTDQAILDAEAKIIEEYGNVDTKMFQPYFDATSSEGLRSEEPGLTQDMYGELTKVLQSVITDKNADVTALMNTANDNYQKLLDDTYSAN